MLERVRTRVNGRQQVLGTCQEGPRSANSAIRGLSYGITVCQLTMRQCGTLEAYLCCYITFLLLRGLTAALVFFGLLQSFHASKHSEYRVEGAWTCSAPHSICILPRPAARLWIHSTLSDYLEKRLHSEAWWIGLIRHRGMGVNTICGHILSKPASS